MFVSRCACGTVTVSAGQTALYQNPNTVTHGTHTLCLEYLGYQTHKHSLSDCSKWKRCGVKSRRVINSPQRWQREELGRQMGLCGNLLLVKKKRSTEAKSPEHGTNNKALYVIPDSSVPGQLFPLKRKLKVGSSLLGAENLRLQTPVHLSSCLDRNQVKYLGIFPSRIKMYKVQGSFGTTVMSVMNKSGQIQFIFSLTVTTTYVCSVDTPLHVRFR